MSNPEQSFFASPEDSSDNSSEARLPESHTPHKLEDIWHLDIVRLSVYCLSADAERRLYIDPDFVYHLESNSLIDVDGENWSVQRELAEGNQGVPKVTVMRFNPPDGQAELGGFIVDIRGTNPGDIDTVGDNSDVDQEYIEEECQPVLGVVYEDKTGVHYRSRASEQTKFFAEKLSKIAQKLK